MKKKGITPGRINRLLGVLLAIFLAVGGWLYWQNFIHEIGLIFIVVVVLVIGVLFTFGTRMAQKDGFLDGYVRAKDSFDKKEKKS